jgi:hypothetical protein
VKDFKKQELKIYLTHRHKTVTIRFCLGEEIIYFDFVTKEVLLIVTNRVSNYSCWRKALRYWGAFLGIYLDVLNAGRQYSEILTNKTS